MNAKLNDIGEDYIRPSHSIDIGSLKNALGVAYNPTATWVISKFMVNKIGAEATILLMELSSNSHNGTPPIFSRDDLKKWTSFNFLTQKRTENYLIKIGLLSIKSITSATNEYTFNHENINSLIKGMDI